jgi:hypothetical protein
MNIAWSGLADAKYYEYIAKFCIPSWKNLPGKKYIIHDSNVIEDKNLEIIDWKIVPNLESNFLKATDRKKSLNFWRKMQSQVWAARNIKNCDYLVLLDTDIEVINFNEDKFFNELENFKNTDHAWATGRSQSRLHDSGFIILKMNHPAISQLINDYENVWESGEIFKLAKSYDGDAAKLIIEKYPSYKIMNIDYGQGLHIYDVGVVHWGSKMPKAMRATWPEDPQEKLQEYIKPILVKRYKDSKN